MFDPDVPIKIFVSYAHADEDLRKRLDIHLALVHRHPAVTIWNDRGINPGEEWDQEIRNELDDADIIVLLVSPHFLASEYIYQVELKEALDKHTRREAVVVPVLVRRCHWEMTDLSRLQALPRNAEPVTQWDDEDEAWYNVVQGLQKVILNVQQRKKTGK